MSFFPPLPEPEPEPERPRQYPVWPGEPPQNWLPGAPGWVTVLARTGDTVVAVTEAAAYPQGLALTVTMLQRPGTEDEDPSHWHMHHGAATALRLGIALADGRVALAEDAWAPPGEPATDEPGAVHLSPREGNGGGLVSRQAYWLWPLPPPGPLRVYCEWPARGIPETSVVLDATDAVEAARRAVELWPMPEVTGEFGWVRYGP